VCVCVCMYVSLTLALPTYIDYYSFYGTRCIAFLPSNLSIGYQEMAFKQPNLQFV